MTFRQMIDVLRRSGGYVECPHCHQEFDPSEGDYEAELTNAVMELYYGRPVTDSEIREIWVAVKAMSRLWNLRRVKAIDTTLSGGAKLVALRDFYNDWNKYLTDDTFEWPE